MLELEIKTGILLRNNKIKYFVDGDNRPIVGLVRDRVERFKDRLSIRLSKKSVV